MTLRTVTDAVEILGRVEPLLADDPVTNTALSGVVVALRAESAGGWCAVSEAGALAVRGTPGTPIWVGAGWAGTDELADAIAALPSFVGLGGPLDVVDDLAAALARRGMAPGRRMAERLFRLHDLTPPPDVPGSARTARPDEADFLAAWFSQFLIESFGQVPADLDVGAQVRQGIVRSRCWLWTDGTGARCAMAVRHPAASGVARIGPVYTPPRSRRHGFGSAVTAAAAQDILDEGAVPVLFTDQANPTSNKIYQAIGFRPVSDRVSIRFG